MIQHYSEAAFPPMPVLDVWLATPAESNWQGPYIALIDTGADFSIAPLDYLAALNTFAVENVTLVSYWREPHKVFLYEEIGLLSPLFPATCPYPAGQILNAAFLPD